MEVMCKLTRIVLDPGPEKWRPRPGPGGLCGCRRTPGVESSFLRVIGILFVSSSFYFQITFVQHFKHVFFVSLFVNFESDDVDGEGDRVSCAQVSWRTMSWASWA